MMMIQDPNKFTKRIKRISKSFFFENYFIALCAGMMAWSTYLLNGIFFTYSPLPWFIAFATFFVYNFHQLSFKLDYSGIKPCILSLRSVSLSSPLKLSLAFSLLFCLISFIFLNWKVQLMLVILGVLSISYSVPLFSWKGKRIKLRELFLFKTFLIALVWAVTTVVLPLIEQNIPLISTFTLLQVFSRSLFIFALCIPFEMRDLEEDKRKGVETIAVVYGRKRTFFLGCLTIAIEMVIHQLMPLSLNTRNALDVSSLIALMWMFNTQLNRKWYFYKGLVDGTMLIRFFLIILLS